MKLFNEHLCVILNIKQKEKVELVKIAKDHGLDLMYQNVFLNESRDLSQIRIDDGHLCSHSMSRVYLNEINKLRNKRYTF